MKLLAIISVFLFTMCAGENKIPDNGNVVNNPWKENSESDISDEINKSPFEGKFEGNSNGIISSADIKVNGTALTGTLVINGQADGFDGIVDGNTCTGIIHDTEVSKEYAFEANINGDQFVIAFALPELNNQVLSLVMNRTSGSIKKATNSNTNNLQNNKERNPVLIGTWRNNETLSSGSGDSYMSFSTDYFIQLNADGSALSWTGASAGMTTSAKSNEDNPDRGSWFTEGKTLHLKDEVNGQDATTLYSCDGSRLMLHNEGSEKKIFQKVR